MLVLVLSVAMLATMLTMRGIGSDPVVKSNPKNPSVPAGGGSPDYNKKSKQ